LSAETTVVFLLSTWTDGKPAAPAAAFCEWLEDMAVDFRVSKAALAQLRFAAFGLGDTGFGSHFCRPVMALDKHLRALGAARLGPVGLGDESTDMQLGAWAAAAARACVVVWARARAHVRSRLRVHVRARGGGRCGRCVGAGLGCIGRVYDCSCACARVSACRVCPRVSLSCAMCHVSCVMFHASCVVCRVSCVVCRVSCVVCRVSCVVCRVSCVVCVPRVIRAPRPAFDLWKADIVRRLEDVEGGMDCGSEAGTGTSLGSGTGCCKDDGDDGGSCCGASEASAYV
jgi:hypothetical protein